MKNRIFLVVIFVLLSVIVYQIYFKKNDHSVYRNTIVGLNKKLQESRLRVHSLEVGSDEQIKKFDSLHGLKTRIEARHKIAIEKIKTAHKDIIDSLFYSFYPDSSRRDIVSTHVKAELCDSIRAILVSQILQAKEIIDVKDDLIFELNNIQIPVIERLDSIKIKTEKHKRFFVGPSLTIGINGKVTPGLSVGFTLWKF